MELPRHLRIQLEAIKSATENFAAKNLIGHGGFGRVYKGKLSSSGGYITVAVKRFDPESKQGRPEFLAEIKILSGCKHENLVLLVGFCEEREEKILVYRFEANRSLDEHLSTDQAGSLTWIQRLNLCYGTARGLDYLHNRVGTQHRVIHRDIKSSNILLDENWNAKISDFGLAKIVSANMGDTSLNTNPAGTIGYIDPLYRDKGILTMKTDVYSFGVVLFEVLCGRKAWMPEYNDERRSLSTLAKRHYEDKCMDNIIDPILRRQMKQESLDTFLRIAYQCLLHEQEQRPSITQVVKELNRAIILQLGVVAVAINGTSTSKYIVKWALAKFVPEGMHMFKLLYVHPRITYVPTPMGYRIHISKANEVVVAAFMKEEKWRGNRMLLPYKNMCAERKAQAEIVHIESDNVVSAIKQEILNNDIRNLVIGASSPSPFRCLFAAKPSLSSRISESAPRFCTVYTVLKGELRSIRPSDVENNGNTEDSTSIDRSSVFSSMDTSSVSSHAHCSTASSLTEILLASTHIPQAEGRSQGHNNWDGHRIWLFVKKFSSRSDWKKIAYFIIYVFVTIIIHILNNRGVIRQLGKIFDHEYS